MQTHTDRYTYVHMGVCVCMYVYIYIYIYIHIHIHTYTYTHVYDMYAYYMHAYIINDRSQSGNCSKSDLCSLNKTNRKHCFS